MATSPAEHRPVPRRDRIVRFWLRIIDGRTSVKIAIWSGFQIPIGFVFWAIQSHLFPRRPGLVDLELLDRLWTTSLLAMLVVFVTATVTALRGKEGAWTAYLWSVCFFGGACVAFVLFGTMSSPFIVIYVGTVTGVLYFGPKVGWRIYALTTAMLLAGAALELSGALPYAPLLLDRSIDAQRDLAWFVPGFVFLQGVFFWNASVVQLIAWAREEQRREIAAANEEVTRMNERLGRSTELIRRYVPVQLADRILSGEFVDADRPERRKITILFSDVEGFTSAADELEPEDLAQLLDEYLSAMATIAEAHHGTVSDIHGDGMMILFGAPAPGDASAHAGDAVRTALAMQECIGGLREKWFNAGIQTPFRVRIGINTGTVSVGSFGSAGRKVYSAIGTQTNVAARIQSHCPPGSVLASHATWALARDAAGWRDKGELDLKGIHYPLRVYEAGVSALGRSDS
jgi:adenylate cyclase